MRTLEKMQHKPCLHIITLRNVVVPKPWCMPKMFPHAWKMHWFPKGLLGWGENMEIIEMEKTVHSSNMNSVSFSSLVFSTCSLHPNQPKYLFPSTVAGLPEEIGP